MTNNWPQGDWLSGPLESDGRPHRVNFVLVEPHDYNRDLAIVFEDVSGRKCAPTMTILEARELYDALKMFEHLWLKTQR